MEREPSQTTRLLISISVGTVSLILVFALLNIYPLPSSFYRGIIFLLFVFCTILVVYTIYQSQRVVEHAGALAEHMTKDMLTYSHELFTELYRSSPVPYVLIDQDGIIESVNFSTARLFGVEIDALTGLNVFNFITGEDEDRIALIPEYFKQDKFVNDIDIILNRPDGSTRWAMLSLFSFKDTQNIRKGLLTLVDITKQKQIDKAKSEFVSLASHQLRTPISGMKWNIELLLTTTKEHLSSVQQEYLEKVRRSLERMDMLVNDFLSVSKFELGTLTPTYAQLELGTFLESVCDEHAAFAKQKNITIEKEWKNDLGTIETDSHLLHMITSNLIGNAVKYTRPSGTVHVTVEVTSERVTCLVKDTGMGIPEEEQGMIFSKMYRASNARAQVTDGTGLGLYIVKGAAEILGGSITFESKEGVGSSFLVMLPRR